VLRRFVVQRHDVAPGDVHWDLMVEDGGALVTLKLVAEPGGGVAGTRSFDHRLRYLEYEGPISGDRGSVALADAGEVLDLDGDPRSPRWLARFAGRSLRGVFRVESQGTTEGSPVVLASVDETVLEAAPPRGRAERISAMADTATMNATGSIPKIGEPAPDFTAVTTQGELTLSTWADGKWVMLFSHPADFTPVCSTELTELAKRQAEFDKRNVKLIGLSIDSIHSHIAWRENLQKIFDTKINYPMIADINMAVANKYGMIHPGASSTVTVRAVFFIDPKRNIRAMVYYPLNVGRNVDELLRLIDGLQTADKHSVACPVNWKPGDKVIVPPPKTEKEVADRLSNKDYEKLDFYLMKKSI
jgi:peroxiredoxin (alkyl hydroperoxide reductase subunit C)